MYILGGLTRECIDEKPTTSIDRHLECYFFFHRKRFFSNSTMVAYAEKTDSSRSGAYG